MSITGTTKAGARERLLRAASELFYDEGIHTVGVDRIIERAGVAKATLYNVFGSKDELIRAYLGVRRQSIQDRITRGMDRYTTPRQRLLAVFEAQGELFSQPTYRGCAFVNASAEAQPGSVIEQAADEYRAWVRSTFVDLAGQLGVADPEGLARQLVLLFDGAGLAARMDRNPSASHVARATAELLLDAAPRPGGQA